jgi:hypothetical protein
VLLALLRWRRAVETFSMGRNVALASYFTIDIIIDITETLAMRHNVTLAIIKVFLTRNLVQGMSRVNVRVTLFSHRSGFIRATCAGNVPAW